MNEKKAKLLTAWQMSNAAGKQFDLNPACAEIGIEPRWGGRWVKEFTLKYPAPVDGVPILEHTRIINKLSRLIAEQRSELNAYKTDSLTNEAVRELIYGAKVEDMPPRAWDLPTLAAKSKSSVTPTLMVSDTHAAETVDPRLLFGVNSYNLDIFEQRMQYLCRNTIEVLTQHMQYDYPAIVVGINGDIVSGNLHEETMITNELPIMPAFLRALSVFKSFLTGLADAFGRVEVKATAGGNHGRTTKKVPSKIRAYTNFDWLLSRLLETHFAEIGDTRIQFDISDGNDIQYKIYDHRFCMTHGDDFKGGQGYIGPFAPITRNDGKKRNAAQSYGMGYDTLLIGHFHQLMFLPAGVVNGSVVGYNEYAKDKSFPFSLPQQALFLTHARRGITGRWPIFCDR